MSVLHLPDRSACQSQAPRWTDRMHFRFLARRRSCSSRHPRSNPRVHGHATRRASRAGSERSSTRASMIHRRPSSENLDSHPTVVRFMLLQFAYVATRLCRLVVAARIHDPPWKSRLTQTCGWDADPHGHPVAPTQQPRRPPRGPRANVSPHSARLRGRPTGGVCSSNRTTVCTQAARHTTYTVSAARRSTCPARPLGDDARSQSSLVGDG